MSRQASLEASQISDETFNFRKSPFYQKKVEKHRTVSKERHGSIKTNKLEQSARKQFETRESNNNSFDVEF